MKLQRYLRLFLIGVLCFVMTISLQAQDPSSTTDTFYFISYIVENEDYQSFHYSTISPNARYVAGISLLNSATINVHIWDNTNLLSSNQSNLDDPVFIIPDPNHTIQIDIGVTIEDINTEMNILRIPLAFSHSTQYLAIRIYNQVFILTTDTWDILTQITIPLTQVRDLTWLGDEMLLFSGNQLVAIDWMNDVIYSNSSMGDASVYTINDMWLIAGVRPPAPTFQVCTLNLETCEIYEGYGKVNAVHESGLVATWGLLDPQEGFNNPILWHCEALRCSQRQDYSTSFDSEFRPIGFNSSGTLLYGLPDIFQSLYEIWNLDDMNSVMSYEATTIQSEWFNDSTFIVNETPRFTVYTLDASDPIYTFDLTPFETFAEENNVYLPEARSIDVAYHAEENRCWVLRDWAYSALLFSFSC